jgi:hypothetical protein
MKENEDGMGGPVKRGEMVKGGFFFFVCVCVLL